MPATQSSDAPVFKITRTVNAPRDLVFKVWTDLDHLKHWWGPKGLTWMSGKLDLRPGGMFHYSMSIPSPTGAPSGDVMWGRFVFREIVRPSKLVWVNSFSDPKGGLTRHPMAPDWPLEMLITVLFTEKDGKTTLDLSNTPINATADECKVFFAGFKSMEQGFGGTFEQLTEYLAKAK